MIPAWTIQLGTMLSVAVGFALGWIMRRWRDRELALEELRRRGVEPADLLRGQDERR
jgi:hypothetical protein